jgi:hypothetical protein
MMDRARFVLRAASLVGLLGMCPLPPAHAASSDPLFAQPAAALAHQIAALTGPGAAKLVLRNNSTLAMSELPVIRRMLESDLRGLGVSTGGNDSATVIRVTLSQNLQGGLWVAEVQEGTEVRVTMLAVSLAAPLSGSAAPSLTLRRTLLLSVPETVLDAAVFAAPGAERLVILEPERLVIYGRSTTALAGPGAPVAEWSVLQTIAIEHGRSFPRDLRGRIFAAQDHLFDAYLPGVLCTGSDTGGQLAVACAESDDPWPITSSQRAFYSGMRDYFTGILAPGNGMELPPFYTAADYPQPTGSAMLFSEVSGSVVLMENASARPLSGANDWGSDFAVVRSGCGSGAQVLVSGSGAATAGDTLRAFEIVGREAVPVSAPLNVDGEIAGMSTAAAGATATMIVRRDAPLRYEVWNVAALCN